MMEKQEVADWVNTMVMTDKVTHIAVEDGGLMLVALDSAENETGEYIEIGGTPDPAEDFAHIDEGGKVQAGSTGGE